MELDGIDRFAIPHILPDLPLLSVQKKTFQMDNHPAGHKRYRSIECSLDSLTQYHHLDSKSKTMAEIRLNDFHITENGFLPCVSPLSYLDNTYYSPWESIAQNLSSFIRLRSLRQMVKQLPILTVEHLNSEREWRRAHTLLTFIAHAYVWGGDEPEEVVALTYNLKAIPSSASRRFCSLQ